MPNTSLFGVDPVNGRSKWNILDHTGPSSYTLGGETLGQSAFGGPNIFGLSGFQAVLGCGVSVSGNYSVIAAYGGTGIRPSILLKWLYAGNQQGVDAMVIATAGSGQTNGTYTANASGGGGTGAVLQYVISGGALTAVKLLSGGSGYTSVPTFTISAGGTPGTVTAQLGFVNGTEVAAGTNLSGETVRLLPIGG